MAIVRVFEHVALPVTACARRAGEIVVVVLRSGLPAGRRRELVEELLEPEELDDLAVSDHDAERPAT